MSEAPLDGRETRYEIIVTGVVKLPWWWAPWRKKREKAVRDVIPVFEGASREFAEYLVALFQEESPHRHHEMRTWKRV